MACVKLKETEEELRNSQEKFEEKINNLENKLLYCLEEHTWKISGFSKKLEQAKTSKELKIESAPFYTGACGRQGYKFKIRLNVKDSVSFGTALSVYFVIMKGEYDSILPWPFRRTVSLRLVDQQKDLNDRENIVRSITPAPTNDGEWNMRPVTDENTGKGFARTVFLSKLRKGRYIVDDTIFVQITVVP